ncbi:MAG: hypothetical protein JNL98_27200 [Bryobacterales bacterium]|nr:hypothetical protein [Bryobacterales bacterium]
MTRVLWTLIGFSVLVEARTGVAPDKPDQSQNLRARAPRRGSLLLSGGVGGNPEIDSTFRTLGGGAASHIAVIPTASVGDAGPALVFE